MTWTFASIFLVMGAPGSVPVCTWGGFIPVLVTAAVVLFLSGIIQGDQGRSQAALAEVPQ